MYEIQGGSAVPSPTCQAMNSGGVVILNAALRVEVYCSIQEELQPGSHYRDIAINYFASLNLLT